MEVSSNLFFVRRKDTSFFIGLSDVKDIFFEKSQQNREKR
jgi:hypothetical protein